MNSLGRILVVDDNPASRYATTHSLRAAGYDVEEASTGARALSVCAERPPDLVILDVHLPDLDGFEICRRLRSDPNTSQLPIVHVSATFLGDEYRVRGLDAGADAYLTHPVEPIVLVATIRAVLRAREAERARRRSEDQLRAIYDRVPVGICLLDSDLLFVDPNPALCAMLGRSRDELLGLRLPDTVAATYAGDAQRIAQSCSENGGWSGVLAHDRPGGRACMEWTISRHLAGRTWLALATDVTERRRNEIERERLLRNERAARDEAEHANRLKDEFLAALSHELRTPLSAIVGWAQVLHAQRPAPPPEDLARGLEIILRNARLQAQLISDLLDISRIVSGKLTLERMPVELTPQIRAALDGAESLAGSKGVRIESRLEPLGAAVLGDPTRLQQVVWNLVHNAIKFTPRGGSVHVELRREGGEARLEVRDTGAGINPEFMPHVFERFRQQSGTASDPHGGLGLGLAIVKQLAEMHGGSVTAHSDGADRGATFVVRLPLDASAAAAQPDHAGDPPTNTSIDLAHVRGLVVDDDPDCRSLVVRLLNDRGAVTAEAKDAGQALNALDWFEPNLLISDIGMPQQDGYELLRLVRRRDPRLPAIALTAYARPEDREVALSRGFQAHVAKPIDTTQLLETVLRYARS